METPEHNRLKRGALAYLRRHGCRAIAFEVPCPISRYRVDVAGYLDPLPSRPTGWTDPNPPMIDAAPPFRRASQPRTIVVECKAARSDFLRDSRRLERLLALREDAESHRRALEDNIIRACEPHLRRSGTSLFPDLEVWDFALSRLDSYRRLVAMLRRIDLQLHGQAKFGTMARYRLADYLYIAATPGVVHRRELPRGWGLIQPPPGVPSPDVIDEWRVVVEAPALESSDRRRARILRNIAVAAAKAAYRTRNPNTKISPRTAQGPGEDPWSVSAP